MAELSDSAIQELLRKQGASFAPVPPPPAADPGAAVLAHIDDASAPPAEPHITPETPAAERSALPRDRSALAFVANSMRQVESGDEHIGRDGKVKTSPKGAVGVSQLMPDTARGLGVDPYNEKQNRDGGEKQLGKLFDKYGNWDNALVAYNWGEGNTDKWLKAGAEPSKLPAETRAYVPAVLGGAGLSDAGPSAVVAAKRRLSDDDIQSAITGDKVGASSKHSLSLSEAMDVAATEGDIVGFADKRFGEQAAALIQGARKGVTDLVAGPVQAGLELTSPDAAMALTSRVNELEEKYGGAELMREHPVFGVVGQVVGTGAAILATSGVLGAAGLSSTMIRALPLTVRGLLGGTALGATTYNPDPANTSRVVEGVLGGIGGMIGATVGKAVGWAATKVADRAAFTQGLAALRESVEGVGRNVEKPLTQLVSRVEALWAKTNDLYGGRNAAGRGFEGFDSDALRSVVTAPMTESRVNGVAVAPATKTWTGRVYEELGLRVDDAKRAAAEVAQKDWQAAQAEWEKTYASGIPESMRASVLARDTASGRIPPPPTPPAAYTPEPVTAAQFNAALTAVNRGVRSAKRDPAARHQLNDLKLQLTKTAQAEADSLGVSVEEFLRKSALANKFYETNIVPLQDTFRTASPTQLAKDLTPAKFFDRMVSVVESGDTTALRAFRDAVGPGGAEDMKRAAMFRMLTHGQPSDGTFLPSKAVAWVRENRESVVELFGRDRAADLAGWANIAERVGSRPEAHRKWFNGTNSWLPFVGAEEIAEGVFHGSARRALLGVGLIATPFTAHAMFTLMERMSSVPGILPMVRAASKMRPGSPELEQRINRIERLYTRSLTLGGRGAADAYAGPTPQQPLQ